MLSLIFVSCGKFGFNTYDINGKAQKGPFSIGTSVTIYELDDNLNQTGRSFSTTITDDAGSFEIPNTEFSSEYVQLTADGYYFNEVWGFTSYERIILTSIASLKHSNKININVLTHIEAARLKYLVQEKKMSFYQAKQQCYGEILKIFEIDTVPDLSTGDLDITKDGDANSTLLAISSILQGGKQVAEMSDFLTRLQVDLEDGELDSKTLQTTLVSSAVLLDCEQVSINMKKRYDEIGQAVESTNIRPIVEAFSKKSKYEKLYDYHLPESTEYGLNLLAMGDTIYLDTNKSYSIAISQTSMINAVAEIIFDDVNAVYCRENIQIANMENWDKAVNRYDYHLYGSNLPIDIWTDSFSGDSKLKIDFKDHGQINIRFEVSTYGDEYWWLGSFRKKKYLVW